MSPLIKAGAGWLYMLIMAAESVALGTFGSVFNTYASLYKAKDNDLLLSMPVPAGYLLLVRLTGVYFMSVLYSMVVYIPGLIVYFSTAQRTPSVIICGVLFGILLTLIVLILSCLLGWGVARISSKLKNKSAVRSSPPWRFWDCIILYISRPVRCWRHSLAIYWWQETQ